MIRRAVPRDRQRVDHDPAAAAPSPRGPQPAYHTRTWLLWLVAGGLAALLTRNPLYLALILLAAGAVDAAAQAYARAGTNGEPASRRHGWPGFLRLALLLTAVAALFNGIGAHVGATVLIRLPAAWPIVGGPLTLEGFAYGALAALSILAVLLVAGTFNTGADTYALLRAIPAFLSQAGLVTGIALSYVPQTILRLQAIREAQLLRGYRFRGPRSLLPLAVPLLAGGLDQALGLAESMESRGFSAGPANGQAGSPARAGRMTRMLLSLGTAGVALGAFTGIYFRAAPAGGVVLLLGGLAALGAAIYRLGRQTHHTRYRREIWRRRDTWASGMLLAALALILGIWLLRAGWWDYSPYPALRWPPFEPLAGLALSLLAAPSVALARDLRRQP